MDAKQSSTEHDAASRTQFEKDIRRKLKELHAVKERLYQLRYDTSRPEADIVRDVKNLAGEYNRIEEDIHKLRRTELSNFENSLQLNKIGVENLITKVSKIQSSLDLVTPPTQAPEKRVVIATEPVYEHETMEFAPENEKLMRTRSTQSIKDLTASQKWKGLFKMFQEWKHQTNVAEVSQMLRDSSTESVQDEIIKLRSVLYSMKQRKNLSKSDQELMEHISVKLKGLTKVIRDLNSVEKKQPSNSSSINYGSS